MQLHELLGLLQSDDYEGDQVILFRDVMGAYNPLDGVAVEKWPDRDLPVIVIFAEPKQEHVRVLPQIQ